MGKVGNHGYYLLIPKTEMNNFFLLIPSPNNMGMGMDYPYPVAGLGGSMLTGYEKIGLLIVTNFIERY